MTWTFEECERHWEGRHKSNNYRSIATCGWNAAREYMVWNNYEKCFDLTLHSTVVVKVFPNKYVINCGGWWTNLTKKKIDDWSGVQLGNAWPRGYYIENQFVMRGGGPISTFHNNMVFDYDRRPLEPQPAHSRVLRKGVTKPFNAMAKRVRMHLMPRVMIGEFNGVEGDPWDGEGLYDLLRTVDANLGGLFPVFMPTDELDPLFRARPRQVFGRERHWYTWAGYGDDEPARDGLQCLQSNITAARRWWIADQPTKDMYETIERKLS